MQEQDRQDSPLPGATEVDEVVVPPRFDRAEDAESKRCAHGSPLGSMVERPAPTRRQVDKKWLVAASLLQQTSRRANDTRESDGTAGPAIRRVLVMTSRRRIVLGAGALVAAGGALLQAGSEPLSAASVVLVPKPTLEVPLFTRQADLIFKGRVVKVDYRNAETVPLLGPSGAPVLERDGSQVLVDGSGLPHAFVTFRVEDTYKGRVADPLITLRFLGGSFQDGRSASSGSRVLSVGHYPLFDVGDRDVLFVEGNSDKPCPLVRCENSRFRLIGSAASNRARVFTDVGHEVVRITDTTPERGTSGDDVGIGPFRELRQASENIVGDSRFRQVLSPAGDRDGGPGFGSGQGGRIEPGIQITEPNLEAHIRGLVRKLHTPDELRSLPPVSSADISRPIQPDPITDAVPARGDEGVEAPDESLSRPWLAELSDEERRIIFEQERLEKQALAANNGDPVIVARTGP